MYQGLRTMLPMSGGADGGDPEPSEAHIGHDPLLDLHPLVGVVRANKPLTPSGYKVWAFTFNVAAPTMT